MCLLLYGHHAISLTGFYNGPVQSCRQIMQRLYLDCVVIVLSQQPCIEIALLSHGALAASVRKPCRDRTVAV